MAEKFDAIVVGTGPSGNAAALVLAQGGMKVLVLERGEAPGTKNVQGGIFYVDPLEKLIPNCRKQAPFERPIIEQRMWVMDETAYVGGTYRGALGEGELPSRYTVFRANFDKWFAKKVQDAGALLICETTVTGLLRQDGRVVGVRTDREGGDIYADVVVLAEGTNALVSERAGLRPPVSAKDSALAVKELHFLPRDVIESRFNIGPNEGVVMEMFGTITKGMLGTAFLYTNRESISVGIGCITSDFKDNGTTPYALLDQLKAHPAIAPLLTGSEVKEYAAHLLPEGGYDSVPPLYGDGWVICGDAAGLVNSLHREGSNLALTSGRLAGEAILAARDKGQGYAAEALKGYKTALDESYVMKDLKKYRRMAGIFHGNPQFLSTYPGLLTKAADEILKVDGVDKKTKENKVMKSFVAGRSLWGLVTDAFKLVRAVR